MTLDCDQPTLYYLHNADFSLEKLNFGQWKLWKQSGVKFVQFGNIIFNVRCNSSVFEISYEISHLVYQIILTES